MLQLDNSHSSQSCFPNAFVIVFLPLLFLIGLVLAYVGIIPFKVEMHTLLIIAFIFVVFMFFVKHNANYAACHMKGSFGRMEDRLQSELRANALTIMGKTKSTLNVADFMEEYYKDIRNDNFANVASSVFPMLGILGTFTAIAMSMPDFTVQDLDALDQEISILLSGIGTAFYASIYGIALSLIWTYFEKRGSTKIDKNLYDLEKLYDARVWKKAELLKHEHMQSALKDQEIVQTLKETFNMDFIKELNEQYLKNFTLIVDNTSSSFSVLNEHMRESSVTLRETLSRIHDRQESLNAVENMRENIEGFNSNAQNLQHSMERFDGTVDRTFNKIDSEMGEIIAKLSTFATLISEQNQMILDKMEVLEKRAE